MLLNFNDEVLDTNKEEREATRTNGKGKTVVVDDDLSKPLKVMLKSPFTRRIIEFSAPKHKYLTNVKIYDRLWTVRLEDGSIGSPQTPWKSRRSLEGPTKALQRSWKDGSSRPAISLSSRSVPKAVDKMLKEWMISFCQKRHSRARDCPESRHLEETRQITSISDLNIPKETHTGMTVKRRTIRHPTARGSTTLQEESMPVYDIDIEDVIEEEEGFVEKRGFGGEEDNIEDILVVANDICSSMIQTTLSVDFSKTIDSNPHELIWLQKGDTNLDATSTRDE
ncbi:hypothetical protein Tco_0364311 [Tanacetum coccineum]